MAGRKRTVILAAAALVIVFGIFGVFYSRRQQVDPISATAFKLNTVVTVTLYDSQDQHAI